MADHGERDKVERIRSAARRHFAEKGYDRATLRDIARDAEVPLGTLSFFANSKRDLVLMLFEGTLSHITAAGQARARYRGSLVWAVTDLFAPTYAAYAAEPDLFRTLLRENAVDNGSSYAMEVGRLRDATIAKIQELLGEAERHGEIRAYLDLGLAAHTIFFMFYAAVRQWLSVPQPDADTGLADLGALLELLLHGMTVGTKMRNPAHPSLL